MHLKHLRAFLTIAWLAVACTSPSEPGAFSARFELSDINGRSLPTYPAVTPGLTPTILSSTIVFDQTGTAKISEHRTEANGADATVVTNYTYHFAGTQIVFDFLGPCPDTASCVDHLTGTLVANRLTLQLGQVGSDPILYNYRRTQVD